MPACRAALYTIKPTIGIVPGDGVMALTYHSDATGPMAKNAKDVADMLDVMVDRDKTEVPDGGYKSCLTRQWTNIRVGVVKPEEWLLGSPIVVPVEPIDAQIVYHQRLVCEKEEQADKRRWMGFAKHTRYLKSMLPALSASNWSLLARQRLMVLRIFEILRVRYCVYYKW